MSKYTYLMLSLLACTISGMKVVKHTEELAVSPENISYVSILNTTGEIKVSTAERPDLQILITKFAATVHNLSKIDKVVAERRNDEITIETKELAPSAQAWINYHIIAPRNKAFHYNFKNESGDTAASDIQGTIIAQSGSGRIRAKRVTGCVDVYSETGAIELEMMGGNVTARSESSPMLLLDIGGCAVVRTNHGRLDAANFAKSLDVESQSGAIFAEKVKGSCKLSSISGLVSFTNDFITAPVTIQTTSSNITLRARILDAIVRGKTDVGQIHTDMPLSVIPKKPTGYEISSTLAAGTNLITLETIGGDITILNH